MTPVKDSDREAAVREGFRRALIDSIQNSV